MSFQKLKRRITFSKNIWGYKVNQNNQKFRALVLEVACAQHSISVNSKKSCSARAQPMPKMNFNSADAVPCYGDNINPHF